MCKSLHNFSVAGSVDCEGGCGGRRIDGGQFPGTALYYGHHNYRCTAASPGTHEPAPRSRASGFRSCCRWGATTASPAAAHEANSSSLSYAGSCGNCGHYHRSRRRWGEDASHRGSHGFGSHHTAQAFDHQQGR